MIVVAESAHVDKAFSCCASVVGDIMGYDFIGIDGNLADTPLVGRLMG